MVFTLCVSIDVLVTLFCSSDCKYDIYHDNAMLTVAILGKTFPNDKKKS